MIRILHVDNNHQDCEFVKKTLVDTHYLIYIATSCEKIEEVLHQKEVDIVLTDYNILGLTEFKVLDLIANIKPGLPVILVTGNGSEEIAVKAFRAGVADYVIKSPNYIQQLPKAIESALKKKKNRK